MMNNGRPRRGCMATSISTRVTIGVADPVAVTTMSVEVNSAVMFSHGTASPSILAASAVACAAVRLATPIRRTCCARRWVAVRLRHLAGTHE